MRKDVMSKANLRQSKMQHSRQVVSLLICLILFMLVGCQRVDPVVKVGLVAPFEGRHRDIGYDVIYSARLAVREINQAGGIEGTRVALVALDDSGNPEYAQATARSLAIDPDVVAVVGHWLPETTDAAAPIYARDDLLFLAGGRAPYQPAPAADLSPTFVEAYESITPFEESPGDNAAPAYAAFQTLWQTLAEAKENYGVIDRRSVQQANSDRE